MSFSSVLFHFGYGITVRSNDLEIPKRVLIIVCFFLNLREKWLLQRHNYHLPFFQCNDWTCKEHRGIQSKCQGIVRKSGSALQEV